MLNAITWQQLKPVFVVISASFVVIWLYAFLHEGGHALAVWLLGGRILSFDINFITGNPSVSYRGERSHAATLCFAAGCKYTVFYC